MHYVAFISRPDGVVDAIRFPFWPGESLRGVTWAGEDIDYALVATMERDDETLLVYAPQVIRYMN